MWNHSWLWTRLSSQLSATGPSHLLSRMAPQAPSLLGHALVPLALSVTAPVRHTPGSMDTTFAQLQHLLLRHQALAESQSTRRKSVAYRGPGSFSHCCFDYHILEFEYNSICDVFRGNHVTAKIAKHRGCYFNQFYATRDTLSVKHFQTKHWCNQVTLDGIPHGNECRIDDGSGSKMI